MGLVAIYVIDFGNPEKIYIGSTINFAKRKAKHIYKLKNNVHENQHLQNAFNIYGEENFNIKIFESNISIEDLLSWEQAAFEFFEPYYNICKFAGNTMGQKVWLGKKHTQETKDKLRIQRLKTHCSKNHEINEQTTYLQIRQDGRTRRRCKICVRSYQKIYLDRKKQNDKCI